MKKPVASIEYFQTEFIIIFAKVDTIRIKDMKKVLIGEYDDNYSLKISIVC